MIDDNVEELFLVGGIVASLSCFAIAAIVYFLSDCVSVICN